MAGATPAVANGLAEMMAANLALAQTDLHVRLECEPGDALTPGSELAVSVTVRMPAVHLPALGSVGEWNWTAGHREPVDLYGSAR